MKAIPSIILLCIALAGCTFDAPPQGITLEFCPASQAKEQLTSEDGMTALWSPFDYQARLGSAQATRAQLLEFIGSQALDWTDAEIQAISAAADSLNERCRREGYIFPHADTVRILKTTMKEEGGAGGYTRDDYIVLQPGLDKAPSEVIQRLLAHEMFHVLTRTNEDFRKDMYAMIGFSVASEPFDFPQDLAPRRITNPDVNSFDSFATFMIDGTPTQCTMAIYASKPYEGGSFFDYISVGLLPLEECVAQGTDQTKVYQISDASDFFDKVGRNTSYVINPEEIMADNFSFALTDRDSLPSMELIERIKSYLKGQSI